MPGRVTAPFLDRPSQGHNRRSRRSRTASTWCGHLRLSYAGPRCRLRCGPCGASPRRQLRIRRSSYGHSQKIDYALRNDGNVRPAPRLTGAAARSSEPGTAEQAQALAQHYQARAEHARALGSAAYKTEEIQRAEAQEAKYSVLADELSAQPVWTNRPRRSPSTTPRWRNTTARWPVAPPTSGDAWTGPRRRRDTTKSLEAPPAPAGSDDRDPPRARAGAIRSSRVRDGEQAGRAPAHLRADRRRSLGEQLLDPSPASTGNRVCPARACRRGGFWRMTPRRSTRKLTLVKSRC